MTETEWGGASLEQRLAFLRQRCATEQRKLGLLALGACRLIWTLLLDLRSRQAIEAMEAIWDSPHPRQVPQGVIRSALRGSKWSSHYGRAAETAANAVNQVLNLYPVGQIGFVLSQVSIALSATGCQTSNNDRHLPLVDCVFGNPFRPVTLDSSWRTEAVVALAEGIYAERAFERMPVLADALEDAGCSHGDVLSHCRSGGPHVKGCWVVDLLTGRE